MKAFSSPAGHLAYRVIRAPKAPLFWLLSNWLRLSFIKGWLAYHLAPILGKLFGFTAIISKLEGRVIRADGSIEDYGVMDYRVITTVFVNLIATQFAAQANIGAFFYHALGITGTAPAIGDTQLASEITTQYTPASTRATGTHTSGTNIYTTVATNTIETAGVAILEMGVLTQAATGGGSLMDRFTFSVVNLAIGDGFQTTVTVTFPAGS